MAWALHALRPPPNRHRGFRIPNGPGWRRSIPCGLQVEVPRPRPPRLAAPPSAQPRGACAFAMSSARRCRGAPRPLLEQSSVSDLPSFSAPSGLLVQWSGRCMSRWCLLLGSRWLRVGLLQRPAHASGGNHHHVHGRALSGKATCDGAATGDAKRSRLRKEPRGGDTAHHAAHGVLVHTRGDGHLPPRAWLSPSQACSPGLRLNCRAPAKCPPGGNGHPAASRIPGRAFNSAAQCAPPAPEGWLEASSLCHGLQRADPSAPGRAVQSAQIRRQLLHQRNSRPHPYGTK